ncbi:MAG: radical SAM protein [Proteobacteria bacterium]|nr:radical SAM protein [Pseudomonadota bacterium]MBU1738121.1 radical SAM protein [Pseudomonadota bacterium]
MTILSSDQNLKVSELFFSIQGESSFAGQPCVFIRLSGCNLRCSYCDSSYTYEEEGETTPLTEIIDYAEKYPGFPIEITGGEPLIQENVYPLMHALLAKKRLVLLETNGSIKLDRVPESVVRIMDIKCPDSGMAEQLDLTNLALLDIKDEVKFVISSRTDYEWAIDLIRQHALDRLPIIHFSPAASRLSPATLADWILTDRPPVRMQLQLHKILWPTVNRGK